MPSKILAIAVACLAAAATLTALQPPGSQVPPAEWTDSLALTAAPVLPSPLPPVEDFRDRAVLLCWHSFLGDPSLPTDFSLPELAAQLDALKALGYGFVDLADALSGRFAGRLNVVATIDDGHRTVPQAVRTVFLPRGIRPALFIYPAIIGNVPYAMDEAALRSLAAEGCLIAAHGYHHLFVTDSLYKSEPAEFHKEIYKAKSRVESIVSFPVVLYAYPYGAYSPVTIAELSRAGYAYGIAVLPGFIYASSIRKANYETPRLVVTRDNWAGIYAQLARNASGMP